MPEIIFILYKPAVPGNVGASARAMKTMGFTQLRLIQPCDHLSMDAKMMAHGSHDILEQARIYKSFKQSVEDLDFIICTTAKSRSAKHDYYLSRDLAEVINGKTESLERVGIIFGTEESGLPNSIIQQADIAVNIPMASGYPSLNLSQSVMVMAYELSLLGKEEPADRKRVVNPASFRELKLRVITLLERIGVPQGTPLHHRIMERVAILRSEDISLLHSITSKFADHNFKNED